MNDSTLYLPKIEKYADKLAEQLKIIEASLKNNSTCISEKSTLLGNAIGAINTTTGYVDTLCQINQLIKKSAPEKAKKSLLCDTLLIGRKLQNANVHAYKLVILYWSRVISDNKKNAHSNEFAFRKLEGIYRQFSLQTITQLKGNVDVKSLEEHYTEAVHLFHAHIDQFSEIDVSTLWHHIWLHSIFAPKLPWREKSKQVNNVIDYTVDKLTPAEDKRKKFQTLIKKIKGQLRTLFRISTSDIRANVLRHDNCKTISDTTITSCANAFLNIQTEAAELNLDDLVCESARDLCMSTNLVRTIITNMQNLAPRQRNFKKLKELLKLAEKTIKLTTQNQDCIILFRIRVNLATACKAAEFNPQIAMNFTKSLINMAKYLIVDEFKQNKEVAELFKRADENFSKLVRRSLLVESEPKIKLPKSIKQRRRKKTKKPKLTPIAVTRLELPKTNPEQFSEVNIEPITPNSSNNIEFKSTSMRKTALFYSHPADYVFSGFFRTNIINQVVPKLICINIRIPLPQQIQLVIKILEHKQQCALLFSGALRDYLLSNTIVDYDIATSLDFQSLCILFRNFNPAIRRNLNMITLDIAGVKIDIRSYKTPDNKRTSLMNALMQNAKFEIEKLYYSPTDKLLYCTPSAKEGLLTKRNHATNDLSNIIQNDPTIILRLIYLKVVKKINYPKGFRSLKKELLKARNDQLATKVVSLLTSTHAFEIFKELRKLKLFNELFPSLKQFDASDLKDHFESLFTSIYKKDDPVTTLFSQCLWPAMKSLPGKNHAQECQQLLSEQHKVVFIHYTVQSSILERWSYKTSYVY